MPKLARRVAFGVWRMFPNYKTTRIPSGRLSCSDPNLLAMPTRTNRGKDVRRGFITDPGWKFCSIDESQIEMRIGAHCSRDTNLIRIYREKEDIYSDFAIKAFKLEDKRYRDSTGKWIYPTVDPMKHRYPAKTCILASMYRVTGSGLLDQLPIICANCSKPVGEHTCSKFVSFWTEDKAQSLINSFYLTYPGLSRMQKEQDQYVRRYALIHDMWGRILHVTAARSVLKWVVSAALREAGNFPLQSGAQGTIKLTMGAINEDLENLSEVVYPLNQIHDELLFESREDVAEELIELVKYRFETCVELLVPIKASGATANSWGDLPK